MSQENSELDITDRQMLAVSPQPASVWTEIGEARITHNIFGKAKVRIIRKNDNIRIAMWWVGVIVMVVIAWQVWVAFRPVQQSADSLPHVIPDVKDDLSLPAEKVEPASAPLSVNTKLPERSAIVKSPVVEKKSPPPRQSVKPVTPIHKPVVPRPATESKPQTMPLAASGAAAVKTVKPPAAKPQPRKILPAKRDALPAAATPAAAESAASSPEPAIQLSSPVIEDETPAQPAAQEKPPVR
jgi:cytoskeletal protein RodZ